MSKFEEMAERKIKEERAKREAEWNRRIYIRMTTVAEEDTIKKLFKAGF